MLIRVLRRLAPKVRVQISAVREHSIMAVESAQGLAQAIQSYRAAKVSLTNIENDCNEAQAEYNSAKNNLDIARAKLSTAQEAFLSMQSAYTETEKAMYALIDREPSGNGSQQSRSSPPQESSPQFVRVRARGTRTGRARAGVERYQWSDKQITARASELGKDPESRFARSATEVQRRVAKKSLTDAAHRGMFPHGQPQ